MPHPIVGEISDDGLIARCYLCPWFAEAASQEAAEFLFARHLRDDHRKKIEAVDGESVPYPWE